MKMFALAIAALTLAGQAFAADVPGSVTDVLRGETAPEVMGAIVIDPNVGSNTAIRVQPCSYWSYVPQAHGYICQRYEFSVDIPDRFEMDGRFQDLEKRVKALEDKLKAAEAR